MPNFVIFFSPIRNHRRAKLVISPVPGNVFLRNVFLEKKMSLKTQSGHGPSRPHWRPLAAVGGYWWELIRKTQRRSGTTMTPIYMAVKKIHWWPLAGVVGHWHCWCLLAVCNREQEKIIPLKPRGFTAYLKMGFVWW
jgi:hypothetical protein